jgi:hypothetical protein
LSCVALPDWNGRRVEICVRVVDGEVLAEEIAYNDKKRRNFLMGTSGILFLHLVSILSNFFFFFIGEKS